MTFANMVLADISLTAVLWWLVVGLIAGFLANMVMRGGYGMVGDIIVGIVGAFVGGLLASLDHHHCLYRRLHPDCDPARRFSRHHTQTAIRLARKTSSILHWRHQYDASLFIFYHKRS